MKGLIDWADDQSGRNVRVFVCVDENSPFFGLLLPYNQPAMADHTYTLLRLFESRLGIQPREDYITTWQQSRSDRFKDCEEMYLAVLQDFLNKDMADTCRPSIPPHYGKESLEIYAPRGTVLQIIDTRDLSHSTQSLLNEMSTAAAVRQVYVQRASEEDIKFPRGMLRWTLTDGTSQVVGIELKRISDLDLKTPFGCKLHIKNCQVRKGLLYLDPSNVKVLGGQVPALYGNNMLKELERRFKHRLNINSPTPTIPAVDTPRQTPRNAVIQSPAPTTSAAGNPVAGQERPAQIAQLTTLPQMPGSLQQQRQQQHQHYKDDIREFDEFGDDMDVDELELLEDAAVRAATHNIIEYPVKVKQESRMLELDLSTPTDAAAAQPPPPPEITVREVRELLRQGSFEHEIVHADAKIRKLSKLKITQMGIRIRARLRDLQTPDEIEVIFTDEV
ncbi:hypothetical protein BX666DRAFT_1959818 [Dichotomocladium elegans]|nr:hypothetical protein BX666DRAFT_1959818 [Dichotomocladium elegans]